MAQDDKKDEAAIHRVDTVPPPPGEDDAYNAPTRVGEMPPELLAVLRESAQKSAPRLDIVTPVTPMVATGEEQEAPDEPPTEGDWDVVEPVQVMDRPADRPVSSSPSPRTAAARRDEDRGPALAPSTLGREAVVALMLLVAVIALSVLFGAK